MTLAAPASTFALRDEVRALEPFVAAGILEMEDLHVASVIARVAPQSPSGVLLGVALCIRGLRFGHVCIDIATVADSVVREADLGVSTRQMAHSEHDVVVSTDQLPWPDPGLWISALSDSPVVAVCDPIGSPPDSATTQGQIRPLVFDGERLYLERYWRYERLVGDALIGADGSGSEPVLEDRRVLSGFDSSIVAEALDRHLGAEPNVTNRQRQAAHSVFSRRVTVLAGGPGTGKTYTVAQLLTAVADVVAQSDVAPLEIALAAPTGKAAARMTDALHEAVVRADPPEDVRTSLLALEASTIHRLLGYRDGISFRHDNSNPLPHDLVIIDETSMVALPLMARLLDALRPDASLVLVGDPFQLASVEAGAVLGDIVGPAARFEVERRSSLAESIVVLDRIHRYDDRSGIAALADAVRSGDATTAIALLEDDSVADVVRIDPTDAVALRRLRGEVTTEAVEVMRLARDGDPREALDRAGSVKVLCGTRFGPFGSYAWSDEIERAIPAVDETLTTRGQWYVGRPVMVTRNDYITGVYNGDTALVVDVEGRPMVAVPDKGSARLLSPSQLESLDTWWSMTIHKSQGSEFPHAVVSLPEASSRVLTNELLYTGITRGRDRVTVVASIDSLRTAIERRISRASGLGARLWP